jgi:predicted dehydrogenase
MNKKRQIRVGVIRCDLHAVYYGALMFKHDPIALRNDKAARGHAAYFYFYLSYNDPRKITVPTVDGFRLVKVWDENRQLSEAMSIIFDDHPTVCDTFEEVSDDVDLVFIADCNGDGSDHLKLATPGLKKKVPTFVDKPFAYEVKDARAIIKLANEYKTPVMSLSILRVLPHATRFRNRFAELDGPKFGIIKGGGDNMAGHIHTISLAQHLFGNGVESVECMGQTPLAYVHLNYGKKPDRPTAGVVLCCAGGLTYHGSMYASAYSELGAIHSPNFGDFEFPWGTAKILEMIKTMVKTKKPQVSYEEMVECIAIATAARLAQKTRKQVYLKDLLY